jgi:dTDP-3-amino-3,4,6-trideoxy-alpha-D-glucose transaminase
MRLTTTATATSTWPREVPEAGRVPLLDLRAATAELATELSDAAARVLRSGWYVGGDEVAAFETEWAGFCGAASSVGTGNGLDALTLTLRALEIGRGDKVIVPSFTFIATWLAVSAVGATPVPVEPDPATGNIDPEGIGGAIGPRTRAIIAVHLYGQPADMDAIDAVVSATGAHVIEDAAQAHGARWWGRRAGALGTAAAFSFYPVKNLGALGDGGAVVTSDQTIANTVRMLGNYGARAKYNHEVPGVNSRLDALQAALLRVKLRRLDEWNERRRHVARRYVEELNDLPWLSLPQVHGSAEPVWHLFVVRTEDRDGLRDHLTARGIETGLHYPVPPHRSGAYDSFGFRLPIADRLAAQSLSLPIGPHLSDAQVDLVVDSVRSCRR